MKNVRFDGWTFLAAIGAGLFLSRCVIWLMTGISPWDQLGQ